MANLFQPSLNRVTDSNGNPVSGAKMYFYLTGTTTNASWFTDQAGTVEGTNPLTADSAGQFAEAYVDPDTTYRIKLTDSTGATTFWDVDPVRGYDIGAVQTAADEALASATAAATSATNAATAETAAEAAQAAAEAAQALVEAANTYRTGIATETLADLNALAGPFSAGDSAAVYADGTAANNGIYSYDGAAWGKVDDLPDTAAATSAENAAAAAASVKRKTKLIGTITPVAGSSAGNITVIFEPAEYDFTVSEVRGFWRTGGTAKIKVWDDTLGEVSSDTFVVSAGDNTYSVSVTGKAGQRVALYGNGLFDRTANASPATPHVTLAGDATSGSIGSYTVNQRVEVSIELQTTEDDTAAIAKSVSPTARRRILGYGIADAALGDTLFSSSIAYAESPPLSSGWLRELKVTPQTNGNFGVYLATPDLTGSWDFYEFIPIDASSGTVTLVQDDTLAWGKKIPANLYIRPGTRAFWFNPTGGGCISLRASIPGATVNEDVLDARHPQRNYTCTSPALGTRTVADNSGVRLFAAQWTIDEFVEPNVSDVFFDETFPGTVAPGTMLVSGSAWTFTAGQALSGTSTGRSNHLRAYFGCALDNRTLTFEIGFNSVTSVINCGTRPFQGAYGTVVKLDYPNGQWSIGNVGGATADPTYFTTRTWPGTFDTAKVYVVTIRRYNRSVYVQLREKNGAVVDSYTKDMEAAQIPPLTTTASDTLDDIGLVNGVAFCYADADKIKVFRVRDTSPDRGADLLMVGDSITNASRCAYSDGYAQQLRAARAANGKRTAIMAIDGWSPIDARAAVQRILPYMPNLRNLYVAVGSNLGSSTDATRDTNIFEAQTAAIEAFCNSYGVRPIYALVPPFNGSVNQPGPTQQGTYKTWLFSQDYAGIHRWDLALTVGGDGATIDTSLYYVVGGNTNDVHPIAAGHDALFARIPLDVPELL